MLGLGSASLYLHRCMIAKSSDLILPKCPYLDKQLCIMWTINHASCDHSKYKELSSFGWDGQERSDPQCLKESERRGMVHLPLEFPSDWFRSCRRIRHIPQQSLKTRWGLSFSKNYYYYIFSSFTEAQLTNRITRYVKYALWWHMYTLCKDSPS